MNLSKIIGRNGPSKQKISFAIREIETHRRELQTLKEQLEERRQDLFGLALKAYGEKSEARASVYSSEHSEIDSVIRAVGTGELALTQINIRLESIKDIGDVINHMTSAFNTARKIGKNASQLVPALENISEEVNSTMNETLTQLGNISPSLTIDTRTSSGADIIEKAKKYAGQQLSDLPELPPILDSTRGKSLLDKVENVAVLAAGGEIGSSPSLSVQTSTRRQTEVEKRVLDYSLRAKGGMNILEASMVLDLAPDEVERIYLKLVSERKIRPNEGLVI